MTSSQTANSWSLVAKVQADQWMKIKEYPKMQIVNLSRLAKSRILDQTQHEASWQRVQELEAPRYVFSPENTFKEFA
jgi:hypothetical protein